MRQDWISIAANAQTWVIDARHEPKLFPSLPALASEFTERGGQIHFIHDKAGNELQQALADAGFNPNILQNLSHNSHTVTSIPETVLSESTLFSADIKLLRQMVHTNNNPVWLARRDDYENERSHVDIDQEGISAVTVHDYIGMFMSRVFAERPQPQKTLPEQPVAEKPEVTAP
jgi:hypothetical protein